MTQLQLPIFHPGAHPITSELGYLRENNQIVYLNGMMPVFTHETTDVASFKMIVCQFYINGTARQVDIIKAFGINPLAMKRWVKKYREDGPKAFYAPRRTRKKSKKKVL